MRRLLVAVALVGLVACGHGGGGGAASGVTDQPAGRTTAAPLVVLLRYGGIAGHTDRVAVEASGLATVSSDRLPTSAVRVLPAGDLLALRTALERSEIATLQRNYYDPRAADAYQYDVTYQGVIVTADEAVMPPKLRPVVDLLAKLIS